MSWKRVERSEREEETSKKKKKKFSFLVEVEPSVFVPRFRSLPLCLSLLRFIMSDHLNMAAKLESLRDDGHTIIKALNYDPNDFVTIVTRLNTFFDKKVRFVLPPGGEYHYRFSPTRKWSYLGVKSTDEKSLNEHQFCWGQQFSLSVPKFNTIVAGLRWTRIIIQVDSLQGKRASIIGYVVPEARTGILMVLMKGK